MLLKNAYNTGRFDGNMVPVIWCAVRPIKSIVRSDAMAWRVIIPDCDAETDVDGESNPDIVCTILITIKRLVCLQFQVFCSK